MTSDVYLLFPVPAKTANPIVPEQPITDPGASAFVCFTIYYSLYRRRSRDTCLKYKNNKL